MLSRVISVVRELDVPAEKNISFSLGKLDVVGEEEVRQALSEFIEGMRQHFDRRIRLMAHRIQASGESGSGRAARPEDMADEWREMLQTGGIT